MSSKPVSSAVLLVFTLGIVTTGLAGCGGSRTGPDGVRPAGVDQTLEELFDLQAVYSRIGRLTSGPPVSFVGSVVYLAGRNDSTIAQVGVSLANRTFSFQRAGLVFQALYRVTMTFERPGSPPLSYAQDGTIAVGSFAEAQRSDESVVMQQAFLLQPGRYTVTVVVEDLQAATQGRAQQALTVPAFDPGSITAPILAYQASSRTTRTEDVPLLLNPRGSVSQGGDSLLVYFEAYHLDGPREFPLTLRDDQGAVTLRASVLFDGGHEVESRTLRLPPEAPPLGQLTITVGEGTTVIDPTALAVATSAGKQTTALVSFSRSWVVTNYDNLLSLLRYFPPSTKLDELRNSTPEDRPRLWREFWVESDPNPVTTDNEALDQYFTRVAIANERFREEGVNSGWRSDRGEVYITLGEPDQTAESSPGADNRIIQWFYSTYNSTLTFTGQLATFRMRLTPQSRAEFSRLRSLVQRAGIN